jgi:hypothetical protein
MSGTCIMTDGFATHDWGFHPGYFNHGKVKTVCSVLKDMGITLWFDEERMGHDNIRNQMTSAIENTKCLVLFITERYQTKVNSMDPNDACYFEFNFACLRLTNRRIIPVVMEKSMLNQKEWKGRLAAELGNHLFVDMTDAMEKVDVYVGVNPIDNALLRQKCQEIHDRVLKIKSDTFLAVNDASSASSTTGDSERFIQLTEQLDWIPGFFDQMESKFHGTVKAQLQQITTLLSTQPITNRLLQSLDYEAIIKKIFRMKPVTTATTGATSSLALSLSKKKENSNNNKKKNIEIMECFLLILSEGQSELILTILTALNRTLLEESEEKEEDSNSPTTSDNVSFLDFLTSCGIVEIMEFLIVNLPSKSKGNKVVEFQLLTSVILLVKSLAKSEVNRAAFVEWDFLVAREGASDLADPTSYVTSAKCVGELCQTITSSVPDDVNSKQLNGEWAHLDESSLLMLLHGFMDYINDLDMLNTLLSALDILVKDDANNERLGSLGLTEMLIKALKIHYFSASNDEIDMQMEKTVTKIKNCVSKLLQIMNLVESVNCSRALKMEAVLDLLSVLNEYSFEKEFKPSSLSDVVNKTSLMFDMYSDVSQPVAGIAVAYLKFSSRLVRFGWQKLLFDNPNFHAGLSKARYDDSDGLINILDLASSSQQYLMKNHERTRDDDDKAAITVSQQNYISMLFRVLSTLDHATNGGVLSWVMTLFDLLLLSSTVKYYLKEENLAAFSIVINREVEKLGSDTAFDSTTSEFTTSLPAFLSTYIFLSNLVDMATQVFQFTDSLSSEKGADMCFNGLGRLLESLLNLLAHDPRCRAGSSVNVLTVSTKVCSLLSLILSIESSFPVIYKENALIKKQLVFSVETLCDGIWHNLDQFQRPYYVLFTDFMPSALKALFMIISNPANQDHLSLGETLGFVKALDGSVSFFRVLLEANRHKENVIEVVLQIISLFSDEAIMTQLLVDVVPDGVSAGEDTENNDESFVDLFVFLLSYHMKNGIIVEHGLSLLQRWFQYSKASLVKTMSSTSSEEVLSVIEKIMKSEKSRSSKKILASLQSLVKSMEEMHTDDVFQATDGLLKGFFTASEMKEAGMTIKEMKEMGYSVKEMKDAMFSVVALKGEGGYSLTELFGGGYLLSDVKEHYSLEDLLSSGVIGSLGVDLKKEGYSIEEAKKAGKTATEMKNYYSLVEIRDEYGLSVKELRDLGYQASEFFSADPQYRTQCKGFESSVIVDLPFILDLLSLFPSYLSSISLLYRVSRDGLNNSTYHSKCDNQGPHLVIVKSSEGYIFGGYMAVTMPISGNGQWSTDFSSSSFLFSLKNPKGEIAKKYPIKPENNIYAFYSHSTSYAFYFGFGGEMYTSDLKTIRFGSPITYEDNNGEGNFRFTGKTLSNIAEVEVWRIVNT